MQKPNCVSARAQAAHFAAILEKPFAIDELLEAVAKATGGSLPFDRSPAGEATRSRALVAALERHGASDIQPSEQREWATFRDASGRLCQGELVAGSRGLSGGPL